MKTVKKIAWLLSFVLIVSAVFGNVNLRATAAEENFELAGATSVSGGDFVTENGRATVTIGGTQYTGNSARMDVTALDTQIVVTLTANEGKVGVLRTSGDSGLRLPEPSTVGQVTTYSFTLEGLGVQNLETSTVLNIAFENNNGGSVTYTMDFGIGSWTVGNVTVLADKQGQQTLSESDEITLTNFNPETMEVKLSGENDFSAKLAVTDNKTSLSKKDCTNLPNGTLTFSVVEKSSSGGTNPGQPTHTANLHVTGNAEFFINGVDGLDRVYDENIHDDIVKPKTSITYNCNAEATNVEFKFTNLINQRYTSISINGEDYSSQIPGYNGAGNKTDDVISAEVLAAMGESGQIVEFKFDVPKADAYTIVVAKKDIDDNDKAYWPVGNFLWSHLEQAAGSDDYLDHGKLTFVSLKYAGNTYGSLQALSDANKPYLLFGEFNSGKEGSATLPAGAELTVKLIPEYGYQLTSFTINGGNFTPGSEVGVYTFTIPNGNFHLGAHFTQSNDKVVVESATGVTDAKMENCNGIIDSGNLELTVKNASLNDAQKNTIMASDAGKGVNVDKWLEVNLDQIVNKGTENDSWRVEKKELNQKIKVTLYVGTLDSNKEYVVVREHKNSDSSVEYEKILATYDPVAGTLTFESDKFSNYAVGTKATAQDVLATLNGTWDGGENNVDGANGTANAAATVTTLTGKYGVEGIATAVQTSKGTVDTALLNQLKQLEEDYKSEKTITVSDPLVQSAVSDKVNGTVTVVGAGFNATDHSSVQLVIAEKSGNGITVGSAYSKAVQLNISLYQNGTTVITDLTMPITITMPVPTGLDASKLVILHDKNGDGISDETIIPYVSAGKVTFTVTHFSNFAFAEKASPVIPTPTPTPSTDDSGDDGGSSAESPKEEKVTVAVEYTVVKGDTLSKIAKKNNLSLQALLALNPQIKNPNRIYPGQKIVVGHTTKTVTGQTAGNAVTTTPANAEYYVVQKGDFLYRIARKNGISLTQLAALNPEVMKQKYIYPGQKIRVK